MMWDSLVTHAFYDGIPATDINRHGCYELQSDFPEDASQLRRNPIVKMK
jgi:hypothetical protein